MHGRRALVMIALLALAGCAGSPGSERDVCADLSTEGDEHESATVTVSAQNGTTLAVVDARVADSRYEKCIGLSETGSLGPNEGMVFPYDGMGEREFVMRNMSFPLDMVFVDEAGEIVAIYDAPVEEPPLTVYEAEAALVLEVPGNWADRTGVAVGDTVTVEYRDG